MESLGTLCDTEIVEASQVSASTIQLYGAIEKKDLETVKELIEKDDCDIKFQDETIGASPLMIAAGVGSTEIVQLLLSDGAPWNAVDRQYRCAGDYALMNGHQECIDQIMRHAAISEMLLGYPESRKYKSLNSDYLKNNIEYTGDKLMDSEGLAVMMDWEKDLMEKHAAFICHADQQMMDEDEPSCKAVRKTVRVLNVGFGMGIVDTAIQSHSPTEHYIIEAHPQVYKKLQTNGWMNKSGVKVCFGRWQEVVKNLPSDIKFDGIFFDTYAEDDQDLKDFHTFLPKILKPETGRYSFYNGLCPDNAFFHAVACEVTRLNLYSIGLKCEYESVKVDVADPKIWEGVRERYWYFDTYYLPRCYYTVNEEK